MKKDINDMITQLTILLTEIAELSSTHGDSVNEHPTNPLEMLTIKECTEAVKGLSEHTVRQLVTQDKVRYIRTGAGKRGKILVNKDSLLAYMDGVA